MRDVGFFLIIIPVCVAALAHPWIGVLAWTWISIMVPHAYTWAAANMPIAAMVGGCTLAGLVLSRDRLRFFVTRETAALMVFMVWVTITTMLAYSTSGSMEMWSKVMKIDFMVLVTLAVLTTKRQLLLFIGVVVFSLAFYGVKGGVFTIATGGEYKVWGPGGFIGGNNEMALALVTVIPLLRFFQLQTANVWYRHGLTLSMLLTAASALGSHSRGALLAVIAMAAYLWRQSRHKLLLGGMLALVSVAFLAFLPSEWDSRMKTIGTYEQDASAMGRINAWQMTINLAKHRIVGGGFDIYTPEIFALYAPDPSLFLAAHSIYFQVLGEHGFPGLFIYLTLWWFVWRSAGQLVRQKEGGAATAWCRDLGAMVRASMVGYAVGGTFLSLAYFDLPYDLLIMVVLARRWVEERQWEASNTAAPRVGQPSAAPVA